MILDQVYFKPQIKGEPLTFYQAYTTPGTYNFTMPSDGVLRVVKFLLVGGSGGGGGGAGSNYGGGGGGAGGLIYCVFVDNGTGNAYSVVVGQGGAGGALGASGGSGGVSQFLIGSSVMAQAFGGSGGGGATLSLNGSGGPAGGSSSNGVWLGLQFTDGVSGQSGNGTAGGAGGQVQELANGYIPIISGTFAGGAGGNAGSAGQNGSNGFAVVYY